MIYFSFWNPVLLTKMSSECVLERLLSVDINCANMSTSSCRFCEPTVGCSVIVHSARPLCCLQACVRTRTCTFCLSCCSCPPQIILTYGSRLRRQCQLLCQSWDVYRHLNRSSFKCPCLSHLSGMRCLEVMFNSEFHGVLGPFLFRAKYKLRLHRHLKEGTGRDLQPVSGGGWKQLKS